MEFHFIVRHPFGSHSRGDRVTDAEEVTRLQRDGSDHVIRVAAPADGTAREEPPVAT